MPWRIRAMSRQRRVFGNADIFVGRDGGSFRFRASVGEKPAGKSAGETARNAGASGGNGSAGKITGRPRSGFLEIGLRLVNFRFDDGRRRGSLRLATIFCERLAREKDRLFRDGSGGGGTGSFGWAMVEAALGRAAWFETARRTATIPATSTVVATRAGPLA